jgi:hypothetical protein
MSTLSVIASSALDNAGTRLILFSLILFAMALLLVGCTIALLTYVNQRKARSSAHRAYSENT